MLAEVTQIEKKGKGRYIDYKAIQDLGLHIDCTVSLADFDTSKPNPYRISYTASDIGRYNTNARIENRRTM